MRTVIEIAMESAMTNGVNSFIRHPDYEYYLSLGVVCAQKRADLVKELIEDGLMSKKVTNVILHY